MLVRLARVLVLLAGLFAFACGETRATFVPAWYQPDAGPSVTIVEEIDAGQPIDAGTEEIPDAGEEDPPELDAGAPPALGAPYPIVLMHGMGGFNQLQNLPVTVSYFNGVQADLQANGEPQVFVTIAPPYDTSEHRADSLEPQIRDILRQTGAAKVNLIAHSQGGLDARILASPNGHNMGDVIASITTIATPHRGTPIADVGLGLVSGVPSFIAEPIAREFLQLLENGVYPVQSTPDILAQGQQLTTGYMENTFNPTYPDAPGVIYESYTGRTNLQSGNIDCDGAKYPNHPDARDVPQVYFTLTASFLQVIGMQNDGLVPVNSAKWGTFMQCVPADHLKECGMLFQNGPDLVSGFDHLKFFRKVVTRLRAQGL